MTDVPCSECRAEQQQFASIGSSVGCMSHGRASRCAAADHKVKRAMRRSPSRSPILPCGSAVPLRYGTATQRSRSDEGPQRTNVIPDAPWGRVTGRGGTPAIPWMWRGGPPYNYAVHVNSPDATSPPLTRPSLFKLQGAKLSSSMPTVFFSKVA